MSIKNELDQYYTNPTEAEKCVSELKKYIGVGRRRYVVEPSAGAGAFLGFFKNTIAVDLEPKATGIIKSDFFKTSREMLNLPTKSHVTILGNPPFGFAGSLAIKFFNHAATLANTIAFIVPRSFEKTSIQNRLNLNFHLIYERVLPKNSFILHNETYDVPCVFQIWIRKKQPRTPITFNTNDFSFVKKLEADASTFCLRRVGGRAGKVLDGINHSESSTYFIKPHIKNVKKLLNSVDFSEVVVKTAGVRSLSKTELICGYLGVKL